MLLNIRAAGLTCRYGRRSDDSALPNVLNPFPAVVHPSAVESKCRRVSVGFDVVPVGV